MSEDLTKKHAESAHLGYGPLISERLDELAAFIRAGEKKQLMDALDGLHEADIAETITLLPSDLRASFVDLVGADIPAAVYTTLDDNIRDEVVGLIDMETLAATVQELDSDDAVFVIEDLDERERAELLEQIPSIDRLVLQRALDFPEDSAGRLMQSEFVSLPPFWSVGQTIDYLRDTDALPIRFLEIFITDPTHTPTGGCICQKFCVPNARSLWKIWCMMILPLSRQIWTARM